ncbi:MAG: hypothetical protein Q9166_002886 [cf. Caloplaca sp. 2 TL-2023]
MEEKGVCVICLESISEQAIASPCQSEVLSVRYGLQRLHGCQIYRVPQHDSKTNSQTLTVNEPSNNHYIQRRTNRTQLRPAKPARSRLLLSPDVVLLRRRQVYARKLYSFHVGSNRLSRFRDLSPQLFGRDVELTRRARKWIRRELQVFDFLGTDGQEEEGLGRRINNAEFLLEYIIAILKTVDIKGSGGQAEDMLQEFLGRENTQLFLHELKAWLRSPYTSLEDWDHHVQYVDTPVRDLDWAKSRPGEPRRNRTARPAAMDRVTSNLTADSNGPEHRSRHRHAPYPDKAATWRH